MIPIYEQGTGRGVGLTLEGFLNRVEEICAKHAQEGRAKAFAIILRDAHDRDLKRILKDQGAYAKLDRLSGDRLSVFFVHTASNEALAQFNQIISIRIGVENPRLPAIAFFRTAVSDEDGSPGLADVELVTLDNANLIHGLHELYQHIERYVGGMADKTVQSPSGGKVRAAGKFFSIEVLRAALREGIGLLF